MQFTQKLDRLEIRFDELNGQMADAAVIADAELYRKVSKEHSGLSEVVGKYREWKKVEEELAQARPMLRDADDGMREMAQEEIARLEPERTRIEEELGVLLLPSYRPLILFVPCSAVRLSARNSGSPHAGANSVASRPVLRRSSSSSVFLFSLMSRTTAP